MRRLFLILITAMFAFACQKDEPVKTTYTFLATDHVIREMVELGYNSGYSRAQVDIVISEYFQGQRVAIQKLTNVADEKRYQIEAHSKTEYITVKIECVCTGHYNKDDFEFKRYIANVIYLDPGKDTLVEFTGDTLVSSIEP